MKKQIPAWLVLTVICVVAAALLAGTNLMTKDVIADNANREKMETFGKLMPAAVSFDELESGMTIGKDGEGNPVGYALTALTQGFGGEIETTVAAQPDGTISGISVGGANFAEPAGLGARAKEPEFQAQFAGKTAPLAVTKDGGEIGSGHTVTALYEIVPAGSAFGDDAPRSRYQDAPAGSENGEWFTLAIRYKKPGEDVSRLEEYPFTEVPVEEMSDNMKFASAVAEMAMLLRDSEYKGSATYQTALDLARESNVTGDVYKEELVYMLGMLERGENN